MTKEQKKANILQKFLQKKKEKSYRYDNTDPEMTARSDERTPYELQTPVHNITVQEQTSQRHRDEKTTNFPVSRPSTNCIIVNS